MGENLNQLVQQREAELQETREVTREEETPGNSTYGDVHPSAPFVGLIALGSIIIGTYASIKGSQLLNRGIRYLQKRDSRI